METRHRWFPFVISPERKAAEERAARMVQALDPWMHYRWRHVLDVSGTADVARTVISAPGEH